MHHPHDVSVTRSLEESFPSIATTNSRPKQPGYDPYPHQDIDVERGRDFDPKFDKESEKYHGRATMRLFYGYDYASRNFLGTDRQVEQHRASSLALLIEPTVTYEGDLHSPWSRGLAVNNTVYRKTYQVSFVILAYTLGILLSCIMATSTASLEFSIQFFVRPCLKLFRMCVEIFIVCSCMLADLLRPVASILFPWNKN